MAKRNDIHKVLIIGSGPIIIGQACEFDYSGTQACKALRNLGYEIVLVNSNPATIMTDPEIADVTYIEPLNVDRIEQIIKKERPDALLPNLGGQSGLNLCSELAQAGVLEKYNVEVIGVQVDAIERGEDRIEFKHTMDQLGIEMARSEVAYSVDEALAIAEKLGYSYFYISHLFTNKTGRSLQEYYNEICGYLKELTVLYVNQNETYRLKSTARILELLACLVEHFSEPVSMVATQTRAGKMERLEQICMYVDHHYREEMTLQEAADELGLNREYFCRFFKQSTGSSFMRYVNQVRLNYIYQDLLHTDDPVQEIMERHGFFNQKLFYRMFKERYHCTPRQARRMAENNPYVEAK